MDPILMAVIGGLFGAGGVASIIKMILDYRLGVEKKRNDTVDELKKENREIRAELDAERRYLSRLANALIAAGIEIPLREGEKKNE